MSKKAQVTIFIILGVLIFIGAALFMMMSKTRLPASAPVSSSEAQISAYIESCLGSVAKDAVVNVGLYGGKTFSSNGTMPQYFFYVNKSIMPSKQDIEDEISSYIKDQLFFCVKNFRVFRDKGFDFDIGIINAKTTIGMDNVMVDLDWPIQARNNGAVQDISRFSSRVDTRLGKMYDLAKNITEDELENNGSVCISCILDMVQENNLRMEIFRLDDGIIIFDFIDENSKIYTLPYEFRFSNKYPLVERFNGT